MFFSRPHSIRIALVLFAALFAVGCGKEHTCKTVYDWPDANQHCRYDGDILLCYPLGGEEDIQATQDVLADRTSVDVAGPDELTEPDQSPLPDAVDTTIPEVVNDVVPDQVAPLPDGEMRGIWVSRWDYSSEANVRSIIQKVAGYGFNAVFFQVRGVADAYYQSNVEPWSAGLSGTLGEDPGWDPLAVAIEEAHANGLELHAWVNTMVGWSGNTPPPASQPQHILAAHPEWRVHDSAGNPQAWNNSYVFLSPGVPGVRAHIENVLLDLAQNYDVDGVHLDYIRYPGPQFSHDPDSEGAYEQAQQAQPDLSWDDFQRNLLTEFVFQLSQAVWAQKPELKMTAAVWGIYQDKWNWSGVSQGFYDYYQDSHRWAQDGILDAICPMTYWPMTQPSGQSTDFATLAADHLKNSANRHVYMGIVADYDSVEEIQNQILHLRSLDAPGHVIFSYALLEDKGYGETLHETVYTDPDSPPSMPWQ